MIKTLLLSVFSVFFCVLPSFVSAQPKTINPVVWKTKYAKFSSSHFYIQINDQYFYGNPSVSIQSDPGADKTTLEAVWKENDVDMRLFIYFQKTTDNKWEIYDLRTYNGQPNADWLYYDLDSDPVSTPLGQRYFSPQKIFTATGPVDAKIYCQDCAISAFSPSALISSAYGYALDFEIGLTEDKTITISTDPNTGYGVNAVLYDSDGQVVVDQSDLIYNWQTDNSDLVSISAQPIDYQDGSCYSGVSTPCPPVNLQIGGKNPGVTRVILDIVRKSDDAVVASGDFDVLVVDQHSLSQPTTAPDPDLTDLKSEIGLIKKQIEDQQQQLTGIERLLNSILDLIYRLFPFLDR